MWTLCSQFNRTNGCERKEHSGEHKTNRTLPSGLALMILSAHSDYPIHRTWDTHSFLQLVTFMVSSEVKYRREGEIKELYLKYNSPTRRRATLKPWTPIAMQNATMVWASIKHMAASISYIPKKLLVKDKSLPFSFYTNSVDKE